MLKNITNKNKIYLLIIIGVLLISLIGFAFAYFIVTPALGNGSDITTTTENVNSLVFQKGVDINLSASLANFDQTKGNLTGETSSTATLTGKVGSMETYYAYIDIKSNNYVYTTADSKPEIILTITNPNNLPVTSIDGLNYVTTTDRITNQQISGFDVTTKTGLFSIAELFPIEVLSGTNNVDQWDIKLTFVNLDSEQTLNEGKLLEAQLILQKDKIAYFADTILEDNEGKAAIEAKPSPDFSKVATTDEGMFAIEDDFGTSYYYRGAVDDNWVYFAGYYWRILRINGDGSIRLFYYGMQAPTEADKVNKISTDSVYPMSENYLTSILEFIPSSNYDGMSGTSDLYKATQEFYYYGILEPSDGDKYLSDQYFCASRQRYLKDYNETGHAYIPVDYIQGTFGEYYYDIHFNKIPTDLKCYSQDDLYTMQGSAVGNALLDHPVGLITAEEAVLAGGYLAIGENNNDFDLAENTNYFLYTGQGSITVSPSSAFEMEGARYNMVVINSSEGELYDYGVNKYNPVVNIRSDVQIISGNGTWNDPYKFHE